MALINIKCHRYLINFRKFNSESLNKVIRGYCFDNVIGIYIMEKNIENIISNFFRNQCNEEQLETLLNFIS